ncbi:hypothetical protein K2173_021396 [Erythroxylum novogranatense]|uniref:Cyclin-dependent kinase inhibitor n=1 Tax=Erythroxylum novogranatense TaxID=1862640 RepID=A0AAV8TXH2_9ROSI|nr:hypothetical protein K2173_021396 [Erythroxylum novogranatense]
MSEIAGVRTRPRSLALETVVSTVTAKKRKINREELNTSTSYVKFRSTTADTTRRTRSSNRRRERVTITTENLVSQSPEVNSDFWSVIDEDWCASPRSDHASTSCCSSNGPSDRVKFADLKEKSVEGETSMDYSCGERRETTSSSELLDDLDSTTRPLETSSGRSSTTAKKIPTESELEEFFAEAEKGSKEYFMKYNYDIEKDEPLEGRWEWFRLKP